MVIKPTRVIHYRIAVTKAYSAHRGNEQSR